MIALLPNRRQFLATSVTAAATIATAAHAKPIAKPFQLRYLLASCMYGYLPLPELLPQVELIGAEGLDIWPKVHGNQREQLAAMGEEAFQKLLAEHSVPLSCITQYKLGPFGLQQEMQLCKRLGCKLMVTGGSGPVGLSGAELKQAVAQFCEKMKPHLAVAEEAGVTIAIENHGNNLIDSPDSLQWLADLRPSENLAVALAPYHLPLEAEGMGKLIRSLGNRISMFYAWQHGDGAMKKLPKEQELLQMPGRGPLDFEPLLAALKEIDYRGYTEVFMHPFPRGIPILETTEEATAEINRGRHYLNEICTRLS